MQGLSCCTWTSCNYADIDDSKAALDIYDTEEDGDFSDDLENFDKLFKIIKNPIFKSHFLRSLLAVLSSREKTCVGGNTPSSASASK